MVVVQDVEAKEPEEKKNSGELSRAPEEKRTSQESPRALVEKRPSQESVLTPEKRRESGEFPRLERKPSREINDHEELTPLRSSEEDDAEKKKANKLAAKLPTFLESQNSVPVKKKRTLVDLEVIEEERLSEIAESSFRDNSDSDDDQAHKDLYDEGGHTKSGKKQGKKDKQQGKNKSLFSKGRRSEQPRQLLQDTSIETYVKSFSNIKLTL